MHVTVCIDVYTYNTVVLLHDAAVFSFLTGLQANKNTASNKFPV